MFKIPRHRAARRRFSNAFLTLAAVIGAATIVLVNFTQLGVTSKRSIVETDMASLKSALLTYYLHVGEFPTETAGLRALEERPTNLPPSKEWKGPYTDGSCHIDPWGNPYRYCFSASEDGPVITISSNGPDGLMNTADGIAISFPNFQALDYLSLEELEQVGE